MRARIRTRILVTSGLVGLLFSLLAPRLIAQSAPVTAGEMPATGGPEAYGTSDYTITTVPGVAFAAGGSGTVYNTSGSLGRAVSAAGGQFFANANIPAGAVIDYIGFNNLNDSTVGVMNARLWSRDQFGNVAQLLTVGNTAHNTWQTDISSAAAGVFWPGDPGGAGRTLILGVEVAPSGGTQFFGSVQVWWKRSVSPAPVAASFNDVPTNHPFFQFIEALKSSGITGGCNAAPPLFCPDSPVTRGQMAVFLAKALGLHWPG